MDWHKKAILVIFGLVVTMYMQLSVAAKLNKCVDENGKITFTQMGCSNKETKKRIDVEPSPNSMDGLSSAAKRAIQKSAGKYSKSTRTISSSRPKKRCNLR